MRANDPNLPFLRHIAQALGELRQQVVFVGGAVAGLLVTDPLAASVRADSTGECGSFCGDQARSIRQQRRRRLPQQP